MKFKRWFIALAALCVLVGGTTVTSTACRTAAPVTITEPSAKVAYELEDAVDIINLLQHEAIRFSHAGKLPRATALKVVAYRRSAAKVIDDAIENGTGKAAAIATVSSGLTELEKNLTNPEQETLRVAIGSVRTILTALGGQ